MKTLHIPIIWAAQVILFLGLCKAHCEPTNRSVAPFPIPLWLEGRNDLLPPITKEVYDMAVKDFFILSRRQADDQPLPKVTQPEIESAKELLSLGAQLGQVLIWRYVEDPPKETTSRDKLDNFGLNKAGPLEMLNRDSTLDAWMVPLLRVRLEWAKKHFEAGDLEQTPFSWMELGAIEGYFAYHGTLEDWNKVYDLEEALIKSKNKLAGIQTIGARSVEAEANAYRRKNYSVYHKPIHENYRWVEKYVGPVQSGKAVGTPVTSDVSDPVKMAAWKKKQAGDEEEEAKPWLQRPSVFSILPILVAVAGVFWLVWKRLK